MPLKPGSTLLNGQYEIIAEIGRGGFGHVYQARDTHLGDPVAIKELIPGLVGDAAMLKRFLAEAKATLRLTHIRIVRTHHIFPVEEISGETRYYIVMEYMPGGSLEDRLGALAQRGGAGNLQPEEAVRIAAEVCEGLAFAHSLGVVHCDLKPANVLFDAGAGAKVADFGIAHVSDDMLSRTWMTPAGFTAGTLPYMSPEQTKGVRDDPRIDVYAVGAVLYRMLTGRTYLSFDQRETPWAQADNVMRIHTEAPAAPGEHNRGVPSWLDALVLKALAKEPEARFPGAGALRQALLAGPRSAAREAQLAVPGPPVREPVPRRADPEPARRVTATPAPAGDATRVRRPTGDAPQAQVPVQAQTGRREAPTPLAQSGGSRMAQAEPPPVVVADLDGVFRQEPEARPAAAGSEPVPKRLLLAMAVVGIILGAALIALLAWPLRWYVMGLTGRVFKWYLAWVSVAIAVVWAVRTGVVVRTRLRALACLGTMAAGGAIYVALYFSFELDPLATFASYTRTNLHDAPEVLLLAALAFGLMVAGASLARKGSEGEDWRLDLALGLGLCAGVLWHGTLIARPFRARHQDWIEATRYAFSGLGLLLVLLAVSLWPLRTRLASPSAGSRHAPSPSLGHLLFLVTMAAAVGCAAGFQLLADTWFYFGGWEPLYRVTSVAAVAGIATALVAMHALRRWPRSKVLWISVVLALSGVALRYAIILGMVRLRADLVSCLAGAGFGGIVAVLSSLGTTRRWNWLAELAIIVGFVVPPYLLWTAQAHTAQGLALLSGGLLVLLAAFFFWFFRLRPDLRGPLEG